MRRAAKVDANQGEVVQALRSAGCTVQLLHAVGKGCPDLLVGHRGRNVLIEVKDGAKPFYARQLTDDQIEWHRDWRGQVTTCKSAEEALTVMGLRHEH